MSVHSEFSANISNAVAPGVDAPHRIAVSDTAYLGPKAIKGLEAIAPFRPDAFHSSLSAATHDA